MTFKYDDEYFDVKVDYFFCTFDLTGGKFFVRNTNLFRLFI